MVIGDGFVWGHLGKTGGDATTRMFAAVPHLVVSADDPADPAKHATFDERQTATGVDLAGRTRLMNLRRLPHWLLSWTMHQATHNAVPVVASELRAGRVRSLDRPGWLPRLRPAIADRAVHRAMRAWTEFQPADDILRHHECGRVDRWLRQEHLADDFLAAVAPFGEVTDQQAAAVRAVGAVNRTDYDHEISRWFTADDLAAAYAANPRWADLEDAVYGDTITG